MGIQLFSPAKLNLFFRLLGKRSDGYHEVESLYQAINLFDLLSLDLAKEDAFTSSNALLEKDPHNSIIKALLLFRKKTALNFSVHIHLEKRIPIQAGLGGGSSNAATTLWGLNELCGRILATEELAFLAAEISSDAPFFFSQGSAYCTGRGEKVHNIHLPQTFSAWLAVPSFGTSTAQVYRAVDMSQLLQKKLENLSKNFCKDFSFHYNDLEIAAFSIEPRLREMKQRLLNMGFDEVVMTGSGSCFFCLGTRTPISEKDLVFRFVKNCQREENKWYLAT